MKTDFPPHSVLFILLMSSWSYLGYDETRIPGMLRGILSYFTNQVEYVALLLIYWHGSHPEGMFINHTTFGM